MIKLNKEYFLPELAECIGTELINTKNKNIVINNVVTIDQAKSGDLTFLINNKYCTYLKECKASAIIIASEYADESLPMAALISKNPRLSLAKLMKLCDLQEKKSFATHPTVVIGKNCIIANEVIIEPNCVIGDRVIIEKGVYIGPGVVINNDCVIKENSTIKANVTFYHGVKIGCNTTIHSGSVIGSDGFGYANDELGNWIKMPHLGGVSIGNNVEIGSNVSVDRGFMDNTIIEDGVIIDNLVQVGHNAVIGKNTAIAGCTAIAGSTTIGAYCLLGGGSSIAGHIKIADKVHITGTSAVNRSLLKPGVYSSGFPAKENHIWKRNVARFQFLDDMAKRIRELERMNKITEES